MSRESGFVPLKQQVMSKLLSGEFAPGDRFFSVREVASWPGATPHLAQRVLSEICRDGYLESVPKSGLFVREVSGRPVSRKRIPEDGWKRLLLLIPAGSNRVRVNDMLPVFSGVLDENQWRLEVLCLPEDYAAEGGFKLTESVLSRNPTAVIWMMPWLEDRLMLRYLVVHGVPVVTYNRDYSDTGAFGVVMDTSSVASRMFDVVRGHGRRHLLSLAVDRPSPSIRQFHDTTIALAHQHGLRCTPIRLKFSETVFPFPEDEALIDQVLTGPGRPDCVLCAESYSLHALERWIWDSRTARLKLRVPEELAVASFDRANEDMFMRVLDNLIPRGGFDHRSMLKAALELLDTELAGRRVEDRLVRVPAEYLPPTGTLAQQNGASHSPVSLPATSA